MKRSPKRILRRTQMRRGTATVEFAFCAPIFFLMTLTGIEIARINMMIQTADSACVQAARRGIVAGASNQDVKTVAESILSVARINSHTVTVTPDPITALSESVTVSVSVPVTSNTYIFPGFFGSKTINRSLTFDRE